MVQLALNEPDDSRVYASAHHDILSSPTLNVPYFDWLTKPQRANSCLAIIQMNTVVTCVAYSPDGRYIALGGEDCKVHIYNLDTCQVEYSKTNPSQLLRLEDPTLSMPVSSQLWLLYLLANALPDFYAFNP